ncbi:response regulator [Paenibacillus sp. DMB20]|uniref:response regulator n=1 Tax=Paenibacillus sp. DMB20 TaxID=1642570 RepID=UPI001F24C981|nr:response regulator [Paenibacillus sp. DMB20]
MLVVDDDKFEREGVKFLVNKFGLELEMIEADDGEAALNYITNHEVDILFTDIRMNGMDGLELAEKGRALSKTLKVIFMSAYGEFEYAQRAIDVNAIRYILKPVQTEEFLRVISQVIQLCEEEQLEQCRQERMEHAYRREIRHERRRMVTDLINGETEAADGLYELAWPTLTQSGVDEARMILLDSRSRFFLIGLILNWSMI